jgi:hypothetical protein
MKKPLNEFISFKENLTMLTIQDSSKNVLESKHEGKKLAIWTKTGKCLLSSDDFKKLFANVNFDLVECPYDDFNLAIESKKRIRKAYDRTLHFIDSLSETNENEVNILLYNLKKIKKKIFKS